MTREERNNAIKVLRNFDLNNSKVNLLLFSAEEITNAFDMAIKALSQEPCEECKYKTFTELYFHTDPEMVEQEPCKTCGYVEGSPFCLQYCTYDVDRKGRKVRNE